MGLRPVEVQSPICFLKPSIMPRKNPRRNIARIENTDARGNVRSGWLVRMQRQGTKTEKFFSDGLLGGNRAALNAAKQFRDELESKSRHSTLLERAEEPSVRNQSGVVGVRLHQQKDRRGEYEYQYWFWVAQWIDGHGQRKSKSFSVHHYGDEEAYRLAVAAREKGVRQAKR
jgi:hypothetical protein